MEFSPIKEFHTRNTHDEYPPLLSSSQCLKWHLNHRAF